MVFHESTREHFQKLRRIGNRLNEQGVHRDDMDDFCKTAWHLIELVEKDPESTREMRRAAARLRSDQDFILCELAANTEKHGSPRPDVLEKSNIDSVTKKRGYGAGRYNKGAFGVGEEGISFRFTDGTERSALDFVAVVLKKWEQIFA